MRLARGSRLGPGAVALAAGACALWSALAGARAALAHGEEEILLFSYLAEEPNLLRISAAFLGALLVLFGLFIARAGRIEMARRGPREGGSAAKLMGPGILLAGVGAAVFLAAAFLLPERMETPHDHPAGEAARAEPSAGPLTAPRP